MAPQPSNSHRARSSDVAYEAGDALIVTSCRPGSVIAYQASPPVTSVGLQANDRTRSGAPARLPSSGIAAPAHSTAVAPPASHTCCGTPGARVCSVSVYGPAAGFVVP